MPAVLNAFGVAAISVVRDTMLPRRVSSRALIQADLLSQYSSLPSLCLVLFISFSAT